jgi:hypothetical protein
VRLCSRPSRLGLALVAVLATAACASRRRPPYLSLAEKRNGLSVWVVDGPLIRDSLDIEFSNFGQHFEFDFIPQNELWLDREAAPDEQAFFVDHLLLERSLMERGVPYDSALEVADRREMAERAASGDVAKVSAADGLPDAAKVHVELLRTLTSGVTVWIVDGRLVRSAFDVDFTEGGHDHVYEFVPHNEVWIDNDLVEAERPFVLYHELHERALMANAWTYDSAHADASRRETYFRRHPNELHDALESEGWQ